MDTGGGQSKGKGQTDREGTQGAGWGCNGRISAKGRDSGRGNRGHHAASAEQFTLPKQDQG